MTGLYRSVENGAIRFCEIAAIVETNGSLEFRLRHFNADLTAWEEKNVVRAFPLIKVADGELYFDGMTYKKNGQDTVTVYLAIKGKDGTTREEVFQYRKKPL
jgi:hypothetical protein